MKTIKFSHNYPKLHKQRFAMLLAVRVLERELLDPDLVEYDTFISKRKYYQLPGGDLILLIFFGNKGIPFSTIRKYTPAKMKYYTEAIDENFKIKILK